MVMKIHLANPRGFCAGVERAIGIVERALDLFGAPVYVRHEVVHNQFVVDSLRRRGAVFVEAIDEVPHHSIIIFSAHGVSPAVRIQAQQRNLKVFDATCPLVTKVHMEVIHHSRTGCEVILVGHAGHPEVEGTMGQYDTRYGGRLYLVETVEDVMKLSVQNSTEIAYATQTTLSIDDTAIIIAALHRRFPLIRGPYNKDICYATQNRQNAVKELSQNCDLLLVLGSRNSSNSNRLRESAEKAGTTARLIDGPSDIEPDWLVGKKSIGVTAGASAPELLVQQVVNRLRGILAVSDVIETIGLEESVVFSLPKDLR
jgi:4-hydroxy-3-methylbut-2-enyl diphosphate reductase